MPLTSVIFSLTKAPGADEEWIAKMFANLAGISDTHRLASFARSHSSMDHMVAGKPRSPVASEVQKDCV